MGVRVAIGDWTDWVGACAVAGVTIWGGRKGHGGHKNANNTFC